MIAINLHSFCMMILLGILASTTIIGLTSSAPLTTYERKDLSADRPKVILLMDQRVPELESEMLESGNDLKSAVKRIKRIGSLSIVNSLDVLRQRVLLELARRKALQDQRQIDANRRFLESIGKRSVPEYGPDDGRILGSRSINDRNYASQQHRENRYQSAASDTALGTTQDWIEEDDPVIRKSQNDRTARVQSNELRLL